MKTYFENKKRLAAALLGLAALMTGCGSSSSSVPGTGFYPGFGGGSAVNGCAPVLGPIPFTGQVRVSPLQYGMSIAYGFTGQGGPGSYAPMQVGGAVQGGQTFTSVLPASGSLSLSVGLQNSNIAYLTSASGVMTLSEGGLNTIRALSLIHI